jgi:serine O-acetyltransferase
LNTRAARGVTRVAQPRFLDAVLADAKVTAAYRNERWKFHGRADGLAQALRLVWRTDAFLAQVLYRAKARLQALGVPLLPRVAHVLAIVVAQVCIEDGALLHPGVYIAHGQVVIVGNVEIHAGAVFFPWVTISQCGADGGRTTIGPGAQIGTGSSVLGPVHLGASSRVGANAVVVSDVPDGGTAVGAPARIIAAGS